MNNWSKILNDHRELKNGNDRYHYALACLRLGHVDDARHCILKGDAFFIKKTSTQIILIECEIKLGDPKGAQQRLNLLLSNTLSPKDQQHVKRLKTQLQRALQEVHAPSSLAKNPSKAPKRKLKLEDWHRKLALQPRNPEDVLDFLDWLQLHEPDQLSQQHELVSALSSYHMGQFWNNTRQIKSMWPYFIDELLPIATQKNAKPELLWMSWLKHCPSSYRDHLKNAMKQQLERRPNWRLEQVLNQDQSSHR